MKRSPTGRLPPDGRSVYLVGFMGCGKSTVGPRLARRLQLPFVDVDREMERDAGRTVAELFGDGEVAFRQRESQTLERLAGQPAVVATGGGAPLRKRNRDLMRRTGIVLWLRTPFALIWERNQEGSSSVRPLWSDRPILKELYRFRERWYEFADLHVRLGGESPDAAANRMALRLRDWREDS